MRASLALILIVAIVAAECASLKSAIHQRPKDQLKRESQPVPKNLDPAQVERLAAILQNDGEYSDTTGVGSSCGDSSGASGECVDTYDSSPCPGGVLTPGLCPGPDNVECCLLKWGSCGGDGSCITTALCAYLGGVATPGECPGPYEVQCCTPGANPSPPGPAPSSNVGALVTWANDNCASSQGWECAEFSARAIAAGGFIPGLGPEDSTDTYADWNGYNLRLVSELHDYLVSIGWSEQSTDPSAIQAGWPIFGCAYYCPSGGWEHACIGVGDGIIDCHNAEQCQASAAGDFSGCSQCVVNSILAPP